jgi:hypothetical protein
MNEMTKNFFTCVFGVLVAAMLVPSAVARADIRDTEFVQYLESHGIHLPSASLAVNMAHTMCQDLEEGHSQKEEVDELTGEDKLTLTQAETFIGAATAEYCPDKHRSAKPTGNG